MAHFALLWKARTIEKYRHNYENEKYQSIQNTNTPIPQRSLSQRLRCYRQDTQKRFSRIFQRIYPEGSSLSNFFLYLKTDQTCLTFVLKSLLGSLIGLALTYLCFLFLVFQLSISLFHAMIVSSIIGVLLTMGLAFSYRIRCLIFLLLPQFFSRAGRYTLTCYALVLILTGPATNTLKNSEVLSECMACRQEQLKTLVNEVKQMMKKPLNAMRESIKIMVQQIHRFTRKLKLMLTRVNRLTMSILEIIQSTFSWLQWLSGVCNKTMGSPYDRCLAVLKENYKQNFKPTFLQLALFAVEVKEICQKVKNHKSICVFTDFVNGSFVVSIKRRLRNFSQRVKDMLYLQIHVQHSYSFSSNTSHSASQVAAGIVTEIRKRADPLLTWLSWSSCVTSLFFLLIIFRAKYYQHMFETRSRFDNKYITKEIRDLDLNRLRHGRETILPLNKREKSKYVSTTSFRLVSSEKIHLNRSIVFMAITTFKLLIHMVADYSLYWVLMTIRYHGKNQTPLPYGVPNAGMHVTGTGRIADLFRSLLNAMTSQLDLSQPPMACLPNPNPPDFQRYTQIGILIFLLWFLSLFEPYGLRLRHVVMGLYRPERAKARADWLYNHILRTRGGFMKFARRKLHKSYKYSSEEKYTFKRWLNNHIPFHCLRKLLGISTEEDHCLLCGTKDITGDPSKLQKCKTENCPGMYCNQCSSDIGDICAVCVSPKDYGDLSDVSLEKGSSDDSDDDNDGGGDNPKDDNDTMCSFYSESDDDDILLPEPRRHGNDKKESFKKDENTENTYNMTRNTKTKIQSQGKTENINTMLYLDFMKHKFFEIAINIFWKTSEVLVSNSQIYNKNTKLFTRFKKRRERTEYLKIHPRVDNNHLREIKEVKKRSNVKPKYKVKETVDKNKNKTKHSKKNDNDDDDMKDHRKSRKPNKKLDGKENKGDDSNELKPSENEDTGNERKDKIIKCQPKPDSWCCVKMSSVFNSYWHTKKYSILHSSTNVGVSTSGYEKNNFKTRKKDKDENVPKTVRRMENENTRQYRIYTYLTEQDWISNRNVRYETSEMEVYKTCEKTDPMTIKSLKQDLLPHVSNEDSKTVVHVLPSNCNLHHLVCQDCEYKIKCLCPENPAHKGDGSKAMKKNPSKHSVKRKRKTSSLMKRIIDFLICRKKKKNAGPNDSPLRRKSKKKKKRKNKVKFTELGTQAGITKPVKNQCCQINAESICKTKTPCDAVCTLERSKGVILDVAKEKLLETCICSNRIETKQCCCGVKQNSNVSCLKDCACECKYNILQTPKNNMGIGCAKSCPGRCMVDGNDSRQDLITRIADACKLMVHKLHNVDKNCCDCQADGNLSKDDCGYVDVACQCSDDNGAKFNSIADTKTKRDERECKETCSCGIQCSKRYKKDKKKKKDKYNVPCSCATQSKPVTCECGSSFASCSSCQGSECSKSPTNSYTVSVASHLVKQDFTEADVLFLRRPRKTKKRLVVVAKHNQKVGTDAPLQINVGTITNEMGLTRKVFRETRKVTMKKNKGMSTPYKLVGFKSRVNIIPSQFGIPDIYTASRYLLESQRYYNELYNMYPTMYPVNLIHKRTHKLTSSYGSRSRSSRKGRRAKRLEESYLQRKNAPSKKRSSDFMHNGAKHRKCERKKYYYY